MNNKIINLIDYTSLNDNDTHESISEFSKPIIHQKISVAGICVYPKFVKLVKESVNGLNIKVVTVVNFPNGNDHIDSVVNDVKDALNNGADEIDVVINYHEYLSRGTSNYSKKLVHAVKVQCKTKIVKVILETGELKSAHLIKQASHDAISSGADFLKTSTGKTSISATIEAARVMLNEIKIAKQNVGFKAAGGIRTKKDALVYINLATEIIGQSFVTPASFRIGASKLLKNLLDQG